MRGQWRAQHQESASLILWSKVDFPTPRCVIDVIAKACRPASDYPHLFVSEQVLGGCSEGPTKLLLAVSLQ
jgi:hypothetical protein